VPRSLRINENIIKRVAIQQDPTTEGLRTKGTPEETAPYFTSLLDVLTPVRPTFRFPLPTVSVLTREGQFPDHSSWQTQMDYLECPLLAPMRRSKQPSREPVEISEYAMLQEARPAPPPLTSATHNAILHY